MLPTLERVSTDLGSCMSSGENTYIFPGWHRLPELSTVAGVLGGEVFRNVYIGRNSDYVSMS